MTKRSHALTPMLLALALLAPTPSSAHVLCVEPSGGDADVLIHGGPSDDLTSTRALTTGDVDDDGDDDLLFAQRQVVHVLRGPIDSFDRNLGAVDDHFKISLADADCNVVAMAVGHVDGDPAADIVVAAHDDTGSCGFGTVYVFPGPFPLTGTWEIGTDASVVIKSPNACERLGNNGALALGDLTGDGIDDILVGDEFADRPPYHAPLGVPELSDTNAGMAFVVCGNAGWQAFHGGPPEHLFMSNPDAGPPGAQSFTVIGASGGTCNVCAGDSLGATVAAADVDRDGHLDFVVSAPDRQVPPHDLDPAHFGQVWVFYGPLGCGYEVVDLDAPVTVDHLVISEVATESGSRFGRSFAVVEDGPTRSRIIVGAPMGDDDTWLATERLGAGRVAVFQMDPLDGTGARPTSMHGPWTRPECITVLGRIAGAHLGESVGSADINGEGGPDLIAGSPGRSEAWVLCSATCGEPPLDLQLAWSHSPGCPDWPTDLTLIRGELNSAFGDSLALGDFAGDGAVDLAVGADVYQYSTVLNHSRGAVYGLVGGSPCRFCNEPPIVELPEHLNVIEPCAVSPSHVVSLAAGDGEDCDAIDNPPNGELNYHWELDPAYSYGCENAAFDPNDTASPLTDFSFDVSDPCAAFCVVTLVVQDCRHVASPFSCDPAPTFRFSVTVDDVAPPTFPDCPADATVECDEVPAPVAPTAVDDCDPAPHVQPDEESTQTPDGCGHYQYEITRTWTATDACGNISEPPCIQVITVQDTGRPTFPACPGDVTVECSAIPVPVWPAAVDDCDTAPLVEFREDTTQAADGCPHDEYVITRTWTARDACGNVSDPPCVQVITVVDDTPPVLSPCPGNITAKCESVPAPATLTATDNCDPAPEVLFTEVHADGDCPDEYTLTRTWTARDRCLNTSVPCIQVIAVVDEDAPVLSACPANATVACNAVPPPATLTATDNCDPAPEVLFTEVRTDGSCTDRYTLTRTWTARDRCHNTSLTCTQVITVVDDLAPVISGVGPGCPVNMTVDCTAVPPPAALTATDNCDPDPTLTYEQVTTPGPCAGTYTLTRTWTAKDRCLNTSLPCTQVITVQDTHPPVITPSSDVRGCLWPPNHQYVCFTPGDFLPLTITDDCSAPVTWVFSGCLSNQPDDANGVGDGSTVNDCVVTATTVCARAERDGTVRAGRDYTVYARATDACGNTTPDPDPQHPGVAIGVLHVPHDQRQRADRSCKSSND